MPVPDPLHPAAREFDLALAPELFVALRVGGLIRFDRQAIRAAADVAGERHRRLFLARASLLRGHAERARAAAALFRDDGHADQSRSSRPQQLAVLSQLTNTSWRENVNRSSLCRRCFRRQRRGQCA